MKISIIHPSRNRPQQAYNTMQRWIGNADNQIEYILSIDSSDIEIARYTVNALPGTKFCVHDNKSAIEAINNAAKVATGDLLIVVSDDTDCPEHWDSLLLGLLYDKSDFVAKVDDGLQPTLVTMPVMDRVYYERYGYIYHPDFLHMHCDEELTCVALMTGKYIKLPLIFPHNHYTTGKTKKDELNARNDATWAHGAATLERHAKNNFGIENPVMRREDIKWR